MNDQSFRNLVSGQSKGVTATVFLAGLSALSALYRPVLSFRNWSYDKGLFSASRVTVPVISVGNITLGGTGKTPFVSYLTVWFQQRGRKVAVISRGYGSHAGALNDEGALLEKNLPGIIQLQGKDRVTLAKQAISVHGADIVILDDGFQHRRLARDLDILLMDSLAPFGGRKVFPRGMLRESLYGMARADLMVLSRADLDTPDKREEIWKELGRYCGGEPSRVEVRQVPVELRNSSGKREDLEVLTNKRVAAFSGIGNPDGFRKTLEKLNYDLQAWEVFPDHHRYTKMDCAKLESWVRKSGVDAVVTTEKDLVKWQCDHLAGCSLWALAIEADVMTGKQVLEHCLQTIMSLQK